MEDIYLELYSLGPNHFLLMHTLEEGQDTYICLCLAFAHAWLGNKEKAKEILSFMNIEQFSSEEQSLFLEIDFMFAYWDKNIEGAKALATEALSFSNHALFAHELLAREAFYKKDLLVAKKHYSKILDVYPNHNNTIANLAITLFRQKEYKKAFTMIDNIQLSPLKKVYQFLLWLMQPLGRLLAMVGLLIVFLSFHNNAHVYIYIGIVVSLFVMFFGRLIPRNNLSNIGLTAAGLFVTSVWALSILLRSVFTF